MPLEPYTFSLAAFGAILGVINTWKAFDKDRVKLRVHPKFYALIQGSSGVITFDNVPKKDSVLWSINPDFEVLMKLWCIEVTNLSNFPVTIAEVGLSPKRGVDRFQLSEYFTSADGGARLPLKMEPHSQLVIYATSPSDPEIARNTKHAYARTAIGQLFTGNSPALKIMERKATRRSS